MCFCAQVWNVATRSALFNFRGHCGRVFCVAWSVLAADVVITGSADQTVCLWNYKEQPHHQPPNGED